LLLTELLLLRLQAAGQARVITAPSGGLYPTHLSRNDVESRTGQFRGEQATRQEAGQALVGMARLKLGQNPGNGPDLHSGRNSKQPRLPK